MTNPVLELSWVLSGSEVHPWVGLSYVDGHKPVAFDMEGVDYQVSAVEFIYAQASGQTQATWQMYLLLRLYCYHGSQQPIRVARPVAGETSQLLPTA